MKSDLLPRKSIAAFILVAAFWGCLFRPVLLNGEVFFVWDHGVTYVPVQHYNVQLREAGEFPLWNRHALLGYPLQAETELSGIYPPALLYHLSSNPGTGHSLFVFFHYCLAIAATMFFARTIGMGAAGQLIAALCFAYGGSFVAQTYGLPLISTFSWTPAILACQLHSLRTRRYGWVIAAAILFGIQTSGAHPQVSFYTLLLLAIAILCELRRARWLRQALFSVAATALTILIGLALSAPQVLYCWTLMQSTDRWEGLSYDQQVAYSLPPPYLIQLLIPNLLGTGIYECFHFSEMRMYFGILPLGLLIVGWRRPARESLFCKSALIVALVLAFGRYSFGIYHLLQWLPGFRQIHFPQRFVLVASFAAALLVGLGADSLLKGNVGSQSRGTLLKFHIGLAAALLVAGIAGLLGGRGGPIQSIYEGVVQFGLEVPPNGGPRMLREAAISALCAGAISAACALFWLHAAGPEHPTRTVALMAALLMADLLISNSPVNHLAANNYYAKPVNSPVLARLSSDRTLWRLSAVHETGFSFVEPELDRFPSNAAALWGIDALNSDPGAPMIGHKDFFGDLRHSSRNMSVKELGLFNIKYLLTPLPDPRSGLEPFEQDGDWYLYRISETLPRVYFRDDFKVVAGQLDQVKKVIQSEDFDPGRTVLIHDTLTQYYAGTTTQPTENSRIEITSYQAQQISLNATIATEGVLVINDLYWPGWQARSNGQEIPLLRANGVVRGLALGPGRHLIELTYRPPGFYTGLWISLAAAIAIIVGGIVRLIRRGRG